MVTTNMRSQICSLVLCVLFFQTTSALNGVWRYECNKGYCQKALITEDTEATALSLPACRILCSDAGALWPKPTGEITIGETLVKVNKNSITTFGLNQEKKSYKIGKGAMARFKLQLDNLLPRKTRFVDGGKTLEITFSLANPDVVELELETPEGYALGITQTSDGRLNATIVADNIFGARNGLETLSQLIVFDDLRDELIVPNSVSIIDQPAYPYRGIVLDTARNYISVEMIKNTLNAMGSSKLNSFHWHITDSHSFPFTAESLPDLNKYGAYTPHKIYTPDDVREVVEFGLERGVRVIPEFDAPAHVGEGWQKTDFVVCFNAKPWQNFCVEPPCGQLDPTKEKLYDVLENLYGDMLKQFQPPIFHMGGDEVHFGCWNHTASIVDWMRAQNWGTTEADFVKLWDKFQNETLTRLYKKAGKQIPVILWTSTLTQKEYLHYLPKEQYIIQIWTTGKDPQVTNLLNNGYKIILSNYDALYFDCGFGGWVNDGNNWCSPYIGWQKVYENSPELIAGDKKKQVLGGEAALWTEQADSASVDSRLWPRAAALGEVLWTEPKGTWRDAETRFLVHRERLIDLGVNADAIEPEWCRQYEEHCPTTGKNNMPPSSENGRGAITNDQASIFLFVIFVVVLLINK